MKKRPRTVKIYAVEGNTSNLLLVASSYGTPYWGGTVYRNYVVNGGYCCKKLKDGSLLIPVTGIKAYFAMDVLAKGIVYKDWDKICDYLQKAQELLLRRHGPRLVRGLESPVHEVPERRDSARKRAAKIPGVESGNA